jgi:dihydrofolate synthase/folylpolyglutamate synthase
MVISAPQERQAREVIANRCRIADAKLFEVGKDIRVAIHRSGVTTNSGEYNNLRLGLIGAHQLINAAAAIGAVEGLRNFGVNVALRSIRKGLRNTVWPGRCEVIFRQPLVVLDGAQNAASSLALKKAIAENFSYRRLILVLGVSRDKDLSGLWRELSPLADEIILTRSDNPRAMRAEEMEEVVGSRAIKTNNVKEAIKKALRSAGKKDLILVTGSLFVVGQVRSFIKDKYA